MKKTIFLIIMIILMSTSVLAMDSQITVDNNIDLQQLQLGNKYLVGDRILVNTDVTGDLFGMGSYLLINGTISEDLNIMGSKIDLLGTIGGDSRIIGSEIFVDGVIFKEALLIGQMIVLEKNTKIGNDAYLMGNVIKVNGEFSKDVFIEGENVYFNGLVNGDLKLKASSLELGPDTLIVGNLKITDNLEFNKTLVTGKITKITQEEWNSQEKESQPSFLDYVIGFVMILILGLAFILIPKEYSKSVRVTSGQRPFHSFIIGLITIVVIPLVIFVLLMTVVGMPLGILLGLIYIGLLILAIPVGASFLGGLILGIFRLSSKYSKIVLGSIIFVALTLVPIAGSIIILISGIIGFGAMFRNFYGRDKPIKPIRRKKKKKTNTEKLIMKKEPLKKPSKPKKTAKSKKTKGRKLKL